MNSKNVGIVQARMGSERFPKKMIANLGGRPLLQWVLERAKRSRSLDCIVLATSTLPRDNALAELAIKLGFEVYRGSEKNVLERYLGAAKLTKADNIVRICADNPFVDPREIDRLVKFFSNIDCDYASNLQNRSGSGYSDGFGAEIFQAKLLKQINCYNLEDRHKEHVTLYFVENEKDFKLKSLIAPFDLSFPNLRFDVDEKTDLNYLTDLVDSGVDINTSAQDIVKIARSKGNVSKCTVYDRMEKELDFYLERLFPMCRSITGKANRKTLEILEEIIPLKTYEIPSGETVFDWIVPNEWSINDAYISDRNGKKIVDFSKSNLHIMGYSEPVNKFMGWNELAPHLYQHQELPEAIPYRTSYYKSDWGFCVTKSQYEIIKAEQAPVKVVIDSKLWPGHLSYGEYLIPGRSPKEILVSCYICHPSMANDSLSGVLLTSLLARYINGVSDRYWSYRFVFVPETIGAVAYSAINQVAMRSIDIGLVITTVGGPGKFSYKQSWDGSHFINKLVEKVFTKNGYDFSTHKFDIHGSDERQYSSPGFRINCVSICKDKYYDYQQYHSSLDNLDFVKSQHIATSLHLYIDLFHELEKIKIFRRSEPHGEVMLSKHNLYPDLGGHQVPNSKTLNKQDLTLWLLFLTDGKNTVDFIAQKLEMPKKEIEKTYAILEKNGIVEPV